MNWVFNRRRAASEVLEGETGGGARIDLPKDAKKQKGSRGDLTHWAFRVSRVPGCARSCILLKS